MFPQSAGFFYAFGAAQAVTNPTYRASTMSKGDGDRFTSPITTTTGDFGYVAFSTRDTGQGAFVVQDNKGNTWTKIVEQNIPGLQTTHAVAICENMAGGSNHIIEVTNAFLPSVDILFCTYSNVPANPYIAASLTHQPNAATYPSVATTSGAPYSSTKNTVVSIIFPAAQGNNITFAASPGYTIREFDGNESANYIIASADKQFDGTAAQSVSWTDSTAGATGGGITVNFVLKGGDGNVLPPDPPPATTSYYRYFPDGAYYCPPGQNLQQALDTHATVIMGPAAYGAITLNTGKTLIGSLYESKTDITVAAGAHDWEIKGVAHDNGRSLKYQPGAKIYNGVTAATSGDVIGDGANLENIKMISNAYNQGSFLDTQFQDVVMVRPMNHASGSTNVPQPSFRIRGKNTTTDTRMTIIGYNAIDSWSGGMDISLLAGGSIIGMDEESSPATANRQSLRLAQTPNFKVWALGGYPKQRNGIVLDNSPNVSLIMVDQNIDGGFQNVSLINGSSLNGGAMVKSQAAASRAGLPNTNTLPSGAKTLGLVKPVKRTITQLNQANFSGPDERAAIQAMIDSKTLQFLEPRTYCINGTLHWKDGAQLAGRGAGNTRIVAKGNFPVFDTQMAIGGERVSARFNWYDMAIVGGTIGAYFNEPDVQMTQFVWSGLQFHGMTDAALSIFDTYAWDNGLLLGVDFKGCNIGLRQRTTDTSQVDNAILSYFDKIYFYDCQWQDCNFPMDLRPNRGDYQNGWVNNVFDGNLNPPTATANMIHPAFVNSVFTNNQGQYTINFASQDTVVVDCQGVNALPPNILA